MTRFVRLLDPLNTVLRWPGGSIRPLALDPWLSSPLGSVDQHLTGSLVQLFTGSMDHWFSGSLVKQFTGSLVQ